ncbi:TPA: ABC transporter ATP-binding protein [Legionella pneumophila]|uniref:ABC transporter ATP-binding protein n=1 Tax=Legionella pneumophila TaxID=446 RepID=UPI0005C42E6A|nr:ABC transporter ATP-binding protein [Legionella pneumophila]HAT9434009.1 ATP-binding cassette domain-containing protein [Legionella pneumophila subsp. pneumophila]MCK1887583.1 ABC transporter ATP-binding protein [Legionella pneumophila]MCW8406528.1 ABC transporter ATP-binding protein [Legionella pneumophila]RYB35682.1 ABC transporter ATP-binding protein [Legionella pneumophila]RYB42955.1 ABC transporter ATP-binding protein [Legionella pneumophila]
MIKAESISKYYKVNGQLKVVFENLTLELPKGGRLALLGPNGAGKSTLLRVLSGIEAPNRGRVIRTSSISWPIGVGRGFIPTLTARENIKFVCRLFNYTKEKTRELVDFVRDFAEIGSYFDMPMVTFSSGMRSRVAFGLSVAFEFDFYVIDEVMAVGDANFKEKCKQVLEERARGKGIIMVSHSMSELRKFCDQGIYLNHGILQYETDLVKLIKRYKSDCKISQEKELIE